MTATKNLLVELFVEELPPKALKKLGEAFGDVLYQTLFAQDLIEPDEDRVPGSALPWLPFASPRRLAVQIADVRAQAPEKAQRHKLMPVAVALDAAGQPTPALLKKLAALGEGADAVATLQRAPDGKAEALFLDRVAPGVTLVEGLQKALDEALARLPIPKVMTYQLADGWSDVKFVRPAHGLVALHGDEVVPVQALGLTAGRETRGHRFEAAVPVIRIARAESYAAQLADEGAVIASFDQRRAEIERQLAAAAVAAGGLKPIDDAA
ncbi:MAG: glycine--tRNA ligase subunit beta, partial [Burkholderiaceae bacterium]